MKVYIVTDTELGWDNIVGVFSTKKEALKCKKSRGGCGVLHEYTIEEKFEKDNY